MSVTPLQRAEKIVREQWYGFADDPTPQDTLNVIDQITAQIDEAVAEAITKEQWMEGERIPVYMTKGRSDAYEAGWNACREKAAKVADERRGTQKFGEMAMWEDGAASASEAIAEKIRALQPEEKK